MFIDYEVEFCIKQSHDGTIHPVNHSAIACTGYINHWHLQNEVNCPQ